MPATLFEAGPGCGRVIEKVTHQIQRFQGLGSPEEYFSGAASGLTERGLSQLKEMSPEDLAEKALFPFYVKPFLEGYESIRLNRIAPLVEVYVDGDREREGALYRATAALEPSFVDSSPFSLEAKQPQNYQIGQLLKYMFPSVGVHLKQLAAEKTRLEELSKEEGVSDDRFLKNLAFARRIIFALEFLSYGLKEEQIEKEKSRDAETRDRNRQTLLFFTGGDGSFPVALPFEIQKDAAELIALFSGDEEEIPPWVSWLAQASLRREVSEKAKANLYFSLKEGDSYVEEAIAGFIRQTPAAIENERIWTCFAEVVDLMKGNDNFPGDVIFKALWEKLKESPRRKIFYVLSTGIICSVLDTILNHPANQERETSLVSEREALQELDDLLNLYLYVGSDSDMELRRFRVQVINLAETLGRMAQDLVCDDFQCVLSINEIHNHPFVDPGGIVEPAGWSERITERKAVCNLYSLLPQNRRLEIRGRRR